MSMRQSGLLEIIRTRPLRLAKDVEVSAGVKAVVRGMLEVDSRERATHAQIKAMLGQLAT